MMDGRWRYDIDSNVIIVMLIVPQSWNDPLPYSAEAKTSNVTHMPMLPGITPSPYPVWPLLDPDPATWQISAEAGEMRRHWRPHRALSDSQRQTDALSA